MGDLRTGSPPYMTGKASTVWLTGGVPRAQARLALRATAEPHPVRLTTRYSNCGQDGETARIWNRAYPP